MNKTVHVPETATIDEIDNAIDVGYKTTEDILWLFYYAKVTGAFETEFRVRTKSELV